jgi:hypothetical protein
MAGSCMHVRSHAFISMCRLGWSGQVGRCLEGAGRCWCLLPARLRRMASLPHPQATDRSPELARHVRCSQSGTVCTFAGCCPPSRFRRYTGEKGRSGRVRQRGQGAEGGGGSLGAPVICTWAPPKAPPAGGDALSSLRPACLSCAAATWTALSTCRICMCTLVSVRPSAGGAAGAHHAQHPQQAHGSGQVHLPEPAAGGLFRGA